MLRITKQTTFTLCYYERTFGPFYLAYKHSSFQFLFGRSIFSNVFSTYPSSSKIRVLKSTTHDPLFNLATEDWIFREGDPSQQTLFLWRNSPTVVIGRNQNPWKECHLKDMERDGVTLARRSSGGGAVYQDLGNTNFTFLSSMNSYNKNNNIGIIVSALASFGINASPSGRNDILVGEHKISGSAYRISGMRAFHHGTLLINVNMDSLQRYLNPSKAKLKSKGVDSVRARVVNLQVLNPVISHDSLSEKIISEFFKFYDRECNIEELNMGELKKLPQLNKVYQEFNDWNWRFGETPDFEHNLETRFDWGTLDIHINCVDAQIKEIKVFSDSLYPLVIELVGNFLQGAKYTKSGIVDALWKAKQSLSKDKHEDIETMQKHFDDIANWMEKAI